MHNKEYLIKNACYSVTKYYLCKQNNKRSLLGRKQRSQVARSFPNRYQFSCTNKVTSLFSMSCILRIILAFNCGSFASSMGPNEEICGLFRRFKAGFSLWLESFYRGAFVDIIRHKPMLAETAFTSFYGVCEQHTDLFPIKYQLSLMASFLKSEVIEI